MKPLRLLWLLLLLAVPVGATEVGPSTGGHEITPENARATVPQALPTADLPLSAGLTAPINPAIPVLDAPQVPSAELQAAGAGSLEQGLPQSALPRPLAELPAAATENPAPMGAALDRDFAELIRAFDHKRDTLDEGNSVVPEDERRAITARVRQGLADDIRSMQNAEPEDRPLLKQVLTEVNERIDGVDALMAKGEIDPRARLRASPEDPILPVSNRELRVGVYPLAADPFNWGHIVIALRAMEAFRLDKIIFVLQGADPIRKPTMTEVDLRHPMGEAVLERFAPFFEYSSIAVGTDYDGETNIFRVLELNPQQKMTAFYLVGGDHYKLKNSKGGPDTLPKLEANLIDPKLKHDPSMHQIKAAFIKRAGSEEHVPTTVDTYFLPEVPFESSSTMVREGNHALMPWAAYKYVQEHRPGLYGIPPPKH